MRLSTAQRTCNGSKHSARSVGAQPAFERRSNAYDATCRRACNQPEIGCGPCRTSVRLWKVFVTCCAMSLDLAVDRALPSVSTQLTEAFQRLTNHPAFDKLRVERAQGADQLVVRVGSTRAPVPWSRPEDVLNGGAYSALGLIPHFVFPGFHAEQAELNVLIVDDPSQSFDTTHVGLLLEELRRAKRPRATPAGEHTKKKSFDRYWSDFTLRTHSPLFA